MSATAYPVALDVAPNPPAPFGDVSHDLQQHRALHNLATDAVIAIETELGTAPSGAYVDVATRLNAISPQGGAPTIASAATIAPTTPIFFVSGAAAIDTITPPAPIATMGGTLTMIPLGAFTVGIGGNVAKTITTPVVGVPITLTYDPVTAKWYPSVTN